MNFKQLFYRLGTRLSIGVAFVFLLWFLSILCLFNFIKNERIDRERLLQSEKISASVNSEIPNILNDILLNHDDGLRLILNRIFVDLNLNLIELKRPGAEDIFYRKDLISPENSNFYSFDISFNERKYGTISLYAPILIPTGFTYINQLFFLSTVLMFFLVFVLVRKFISNQVIDPILYLVYLIKNNLTEKLSEQRGFSYEHDQLLSQIIEMNNSIIDLQKTALLQKKDVELAQLAAQVAHDIRSPYSVLQSCTKNLSGIPADVKKAIELSVSRIGDILSDLEIGAKKTIQRDKGSEPQVRSNSDEASLPTPAHEPTTNNLSKTIAIIALDRIISEKRYQYRDSGNVQILDKLSLNPDATILVNSKNFARVISNLLDNAIQAKDPNRENEITLTASYVPSAGQVEILISDTGKGISPEILPKLFQKGATFNKENGTGLGLFYAKKQIESWGGTIQIQSTQNIGTVVRITLPVVDPPAWLQPKIEFPKDSIVLILDDDLSIHEFWKNRLTHSSLLLARDISTAKQMMQELPDYFIVDFDLHDSEKTGLDFIKEFGLGEQSILVTSHFEDPSIHEGCQNLGIKIFPKPLMAYL